MATLYPPEFYQSVESHSLSSAREVLKLVWALYHPQSILDVGCGNGCWLHAASEAGGQTLVGLEGAWMSPDRLVNASIRLITQDLEKPLRLEQKFDLAMSLEVAEHLNPMCAERLVGDLCRASDVVLFSAAVPWQGGTHHVNERPQSYWCGLFQQQGYRAIDLFRPALWENKSVAWWYRQNVMLYVNGSAALPFVPPSDQAPVILDLVHPEAFAVTANTLVSLQQRPTIDQAIRLAAKAVLSSLRLRKP